jgi:LAO/AO transport system kinase
MGDDIQIMKAGIMEIADVFIVNKADRDGAERIATEVKMMLDLMPKRSWLPPVVTTIAEKGEGIKELCSKIEEHYFFLTNSEEGKRKKYQRLTNEVEAILAKEIARIVEDAWENMKSKELLDDLAQRRKDPYSVAKELLDNILCGGNLNV